MASKVALAGLHVQVNLPVKHHLMHAAASLPLRHSLNRGFSAWDEELRGNAKQEYSETPPYHRKKQAVQAVTRGGQEMPLTELL